MFSEENDDIGGLADSNPRSDHIQLKSVSNSSNLNFSEHPRKEIEDKSSQQYYSAIGSFIHDVKFNQSKISSVVRNGLERRE